MFGLAKRAGAVVTGFDAALAAATSRRAKAVFFACDLSDKTKKEWAFKASACSQLPVVAPLTKEELGAALGAHGPVGIAVLRDEGFANAIRALCPTMKEEKE
ncbi:MAG: ribosomal L7Ae/L30e/S12e/Gadd45 family protein [Clostridia bacterium]|nr:ribosomal L7Ae/L30e/S12e/Gadd45 family protein [Clostridia bacterium]